MDVQKPRPCFALLPGELQRRIFESLLEREGPSTALRNTVFVCKAWQYLAQPLLFLHLRFSLVKALEVFASQVIWKKHTTGYNAGSSCKSLILTGGWPSNTKGKRPLIGAPLLSLLSLLPRLESFKNTIWHPITHDYLLPLVQLSKDTLTFLDVSLTTHTTYRTTLLLLGQLHALQTLFIHAKHGKISEGIAEVPPWHFHSLLHLRWGMPAETVAFLAVSRFPALQSMGCIDFFETEAHVEPLRPFFVSHPGIQTLYLELPSYGVKVFLTSGLPLSPHTIEFGEPQPDPDQFMPFLPGCVQKLTLPAGSDEEDFDQIIDVLDAVHAESSVHGLQEICLGPHVNWARYLKSGPGGLASLYGNVLHHAMRLAEIGIALTDGDGARIVSAVAQTG